MVQHAATCPEAAGYGDTRPLSGLLGKRAAPTLSAMQDHELCFTQLRRLADSTAPIELLAGHTAAIVRRYSGTAEADLAALRRHLRGEEATL